MIKMKDTRKLSVIYFMISLMMLLMVCFGCSNPVTVDYVHTVNEYDVYYTEANNLDEVLGTVNELMKVSDNFVLQSDFGIIEVENGEVIYNNIK
jgi:hypothetical protein